MALQRFWWEGTHAFANSKEDETAQHVLDAIDAAYGASVGSVGRQTFEHARPASNEVKQRYSADLAYGELLPGAITRMLRVLGVRERGINQILEMGMGVGKLAMQAFLEYEGISVLGVELLPERCETAANAALRLDDMEDSNSRRNFSVKDARNIDGHGSIRIRRKKKLGGGDLEFRRGNMLDVSSKEVAASGLIVMHTNVPEDQRGRLQALLGHVKNGTRLAMLHDLRTMWGNGKTFCPFHSIPAVAPAVQWYFRTSWAPAVGVPFYLYHARTDLPPEITEASIWQKHTLNYFFQVTGKGLVGISLCSMGFWIVWFVVGGICKGFHSQAKNKPQFVQARSKFD
eukprot:gnl/MRDRNA2_/MRDRNA2_229930_c0_seq1.p1 gnl/MRDRNA2_/MRDRNA2_229930_c0~~gnl/MRDRNA2_/MRDRNA2_229930_c0_seq1.p1  ORF type:complete len:356 (-),score=54.18 gnl/MRDRNA2_/MRDRNA2_229930_c0_seq1:31-1062(-)